MGQNFESLNVKKVEALHIGHRPIGLRQLFDTEMVIEANSMYNGHMGQIFENSVKPIN